MKAKKAGRAARALAVGFIAVVTLMVVFSAIPAARVYSSAQPFFQETSYPGFFPTAGTIDLSGYPPPDATQAPTINQPARTATATLTLTPIVSLTALTPTPTLPDAFRNEDAEMGGSQVTPPPSETPEPTLTMTARPTMTNTPPPTVVSGEDQSDGGLNWSLFWVGFSLPVLVGCAAILYLLDRRPDLFSFHH